MSPTVSTYIKLMRPSLLWIVNVALCLQSMQVFANDTNVLIQTGAMLEQSTPTTNSAVTPTAEDVHKVAFDQEEYNSLSGVPLAANTPNEHDVATPSWAAGVDAGVAVFF